MTGCGVPLLSPFYPQGALWLGWITFGAQGTIMSAAMAPKALTDQMYSKMAAAIVLGAQTRHIMREAKIRKSLMRLQNAMFPSSSHLHTSKLYLPISFECVDICVLLFPKAQYFMLKDESFVHIVLICSKINLP